MQGGCGSHGQHCLEPENQLQGAWLTDSLSSGLFGPTAPLDPPLPSQPDHASAGLCHNLSVTQYVRGTGAGPILSWASFAWGLPRGLAKTFSPLCCGLRLFLPGPSLPSPFTGLRPISLSEDIPSVCFLEHPSQTEAFPDHATCSHHILCHNICGILTGHLGV